MPRDVKLLLRKVALFSIPFALYAAVVLAVDPYCYFSTGGPVNAEIKTRTAYPLNFALWKYCEFDREPGGNILLGDSRMINLDTDRIDEVSGLRWYNFAYGGGTLREAVATFDHARATTDLERVVIGLDISTWNGSDRRNRVSEAEAAMANPLLYLVNGNVMRATGMILKSLVTGNEARVGKPLGDRESFWRRQLDVTARVYFEGWQDPVAYRQDLQRIARICRDEEIELSFVIFPVHTDLLDRAEEFGLAEQAARMRSELVQLGTVYDFAWRNEHTRDRGNFRDPYHQTVEASDLVVRTVWGGERHHVRILGETSSDATSTISSIP